MKKIVLLGSTGSIGENTLRVVASLQPALQVTGLAAHKRYRRVLEQAEAFGVNVVAIVDADAARRCAAEAPPHIQVLQGPEGLEKLIEAGEADLAVCAVVGLAGLRPVMTALAAGTNVALATKETLVAAGHLIQDICVRTGAKILPVDSEHCAVFQCLAQPETNGSKATAASTRHVRRLILTASGGPFARQNAVDFETITVEEALAHPNWDMGPKVSIDSATMMNKGLEIMEARWLFDMPAERIDVLIHPESIVHSLVEFVDGNILAQLSPPDMRFAIQYALTWPRRLDGHLPRLDLARAGTLTFEPPDETRFRALPLARQAARTEGSLPAVLNGANETAVELFLEGRIPFSRIVEIVEEVMSRHATISHPDYETIVGADHWARATARSLIQKR